MATQSSGIFLESTAKKIDCWQLQAFFIQSGVYIRHSGHIFDRAERYAQPYDSVDKIPLTVENQ